MPKALRSKPALRADCIRYFDAFRLLGASRIWNQVGPQAIPLSEIESYLNLNGITTRETRLKYVRLIKSLDLVELRYIQEKQKSQK